MAVVICIPAYHIYEDTSRHPRFVLQILSILKATLTLNLGGDFGRLGRCSPKYIEESIHPAASESTRRTTNHESPAPRIIQG